MFDFSFFSVKSLLRIKKKTKQNNGRKSGTTRTMTRWQRFVPRDWKIFLGNTREGWGALQAMTNGTGKVAFCSVMITTAAHTQWTSLTDHKLGAVDHWKVKRKQKICEVPKRVIDLLTSHLIAFCFPSHLILHPFGCVTVSIRNYLFRAYVSVFFSSLRCLCFNLHLRNANLKCLYM